MLKHAVPCKPRASERERTCQVVVIEVLCHGDEDAVLRAGGGGALVGGQQERPLLLPGVDVGRGLEETLQVQRQMKCRAAGRSIVKELACVPLSSTLF